MPGSPSHALNELQDIIQSVATDRVYIPRFLVALDIYLVTSNGRWPSWRAIMEGDVSTQPDHLWLLLRERPAVSGPSTLELPLKPLASTVTTTTTLDAAQSGPSDPTAVLTMASTSTLPSEKAQDKVRASWKLPTSTPMDVDASGGNATAIQEMAVGKGKGKAKAMDAAAVAAGEESQG
jgi:hypothetical protein